MDLRGPSGRDILTETVLSSQNSEKAELTHFFVCAGGDTDMLDLLMKHGLQLTTRHSQGYNVIHFIVYIGQYMTKKATLMFETVMTSVEDDPDVARHLLFTDMAAELGVPELITCIFHSSYYRQIVSECIYYRHLRL